MIYHVMGDCFLAPIRDGCKLSYNFDVNFCCVPLTKLAEHDMSVLVVFRASCDGRLASATVNSDMISSIVSSRFAVAYNIPRSVVNTPSGVCVYAHGPAIVPTVSGFYVYERQMCIDYVADYDIVFGRDWLQSTGAKFSSSVVLDPTTTSAFGDGCSWVSSPERLQVTDVIVAECYLKRYRPKVAGESKRGWTSWGVNLELLRIAQLFVGPGIVDEPLPESAAVF